MDARRYDRNADQLAQIFWHLGRLETYHNADATQMKNEFRHLIEQCLTLNDALGQMAEEGLI